MIVGALTSGCAVLGYDGPYDFVFSGKGSSDAVGTCIIERMRGAPLDVDLFSDATEPPQVVHRGYFVDNQYEIETKTFGLRKPPGAVSSSWYYTINTVWVRNISASDVEVTVAQARFESAIDNALFVQFSELEEIIGTHIPSCLDGSKLVSSR